MVRSFFIFLSVLAFAFSVWSHQPVLAAEVIKSRLVIEFFKYVEGMDGPLVLWRAKGSLSVRTLSSDCVLTINSKKYDCVHRDHVEPSRIKNEAFEAVFHGAYIDQNTFGEIIFDLADLYGVSDQIMLNPRPLHSNSDDIAVLQLVDFMPVQGGGVSRKWEIIYQDIEIQSRRPYEKIYLTIKVDPEKSQVKVKKS